MCKNRSPSSESPTVIDPSVPIQPPDAAPSDVPDLLGFAKRVAGNIAAGTRLACFRPFKGSEFSTGSWHIFVLALIDVLIAVAYDYFSIEPERHFSIYGLQYIGTLYILFVFALFVLASIQSDEGGTQKLLVIILSTVPVVSLASVAISHFYVVYESPSLVLGWAIWLSWIVWNLAIVLRAINDRYSPSKKRAFALIVLYTLIVKTPELFLQDTPIWYSYNADEYAASENTATIDTERVYYRQRELLQHTAESLSTHRPGITDLYFVGFGSYAAQDVFMKEVAFVRDLFDRKFDTRGRSAILVNNAKTVSYLPLANVSNLRITLNNIASRMDTSEDVLFLFLTSHGSKDAVLSVNFRAIAPNDLSDEDLHEILEESGIKWRILVVSACYSGSFIERLKNEHTLILTAADKDKTSFGCSNDRELTYFGEHFFSRELAEGGSFVEAFHRARNTLRQREIEENIIASDPQIFIGTAMQKKLDELQQRFPADSRRLADASSGQCGQRSEDSDTGVSTVQGENIACEP
jgi:hypothetical protein